MTATTMLRARPGPVTRNRSRATLWWARIVCLSVFGPYVTGSARTEQIAVFASFAAILIVGWPRIVNARSIPVTPFLVVWLGLDAVMLIGAVRRPFDPAFYGPQPVSHGLAAYMLPVALIVLTWYWTLSADSRDLIRAVAPVIIGGMALNTAISLAQLVTHHVAVFSSLPRFWDAPGSTGSVAVNAAENGRWTGIFDQPAEAGVAYGVALLCLIWLSQRRQVHPLTTTVCAAAIVTGGLLTISKVFLLAALPLAVLVTLRSPRGRVGIVVCAAAILGLLRVLGSAHLLPAWPQGAVSLGRFLNPSGSLAAQYTAGRYGAGGSLGPAVADVLHASPWYGFGAGGLATAYDSLWVQVLVLAGIAGVIFAVAALVMLTFRWWCLRGVAAPAEWRLAGAVLVLAAAASLGLPSLTANRDATLLWLVLGILITARPPLDPGAERRGETHGYRRATPPPRRQAGHRRLRPHLGRPVRL